LIFNILLLVFTPHTHDQGGLMTKYGRHSFENDLKKLIAKHKKRFWLF
jgi:hypothetical protein